MEIGCSNGLPCENVLQKYHIRMAVKTHRFEKTWILFFRVRLCH